MIEHYEIAAYGTARTYAEILGEAESVGLLEQTLDEEKETDQRLTAIALAVNPEAALADDEARGGGSGNLANGRTLTRAAVERTCAFGPPATAG